MAAGIRIPPGIHVPDRELDDTYEETRTTVEMEVGPPRVRNKMRTAPRLFNVKWTLTQAAYSVFDIWFQETIQGGAAEFDVQLLDDSEALVWYTVRWQRGTYSATLEEWDRWVVTGTLRAVGDSFATREPGTDELAGRAGLTLRASGTMLIGKVLFGRATVGISSAKAKPMLLPMHGRAVLRLSASGKMRARPFYGRSFLALSANGYFATFGADELILQFDSATYTAPDGSTVNLQFDATVYYPPHIV